MGKRVLFGAAVFVLVVAYAALYFQGLDFGRPFQLHPDERWIVDIARKIAETGDYNPHFLEYPSLPIYVQLGISCLTHLHMVGDGDFRNSAGDPENRTIDKITPLDAFAHYYAGRMWMAILAGVTLVVVYLLAAELLGKAAALFAVAATLFSSLFLEQAHYVTPNLYMTLFALATIYACFRYLKSGDIRTIYLASVLAGLGIGSKYPVFVVLLPVFACAIWKLRVQAWKHCIGLFLTASFVFLLTTPYAFFDLPQFLKNLGSISLQYQVLGVNEAKDGPSPLTRYFLTVWKAAPVLTLCGIAGFVTLPFVRNYRRSVLFVLFAIPYGVMVLDSKVVYPRNLVPLLPIRAIGAAAILLALWHIVSGGKIPGSETFRRPRLACLCCAIFAVACLWRPVYRCTIITSEFQKQSAFQEAHEWFETEVPQKESVTADHFSTAPAVPCPGGTHRVEVVEGPHFSTPYVTHISTNYIVSTAGDVYDGAEWRKKDYVGRLAREISPRDAKYVESYVTQNRRLAETRLPSFRVFDSTPPGPTEVLLAGGVMVYKVPAFQVIEWKGPFESSSAPTSNPNLKSDRFETVLNLRPGEYDTFLEAQQLKVSDGRFAANAPSVVITLAGTQQSVECRFVEQRVYFVTSVSVPADSQLPLTIDVPNNCTITRIGLVRVGGPIPEISGDNKPVCFGENLVANSDFDRGALRWNTLAKENEFLTSIALEATHGVRSMAVTLQATANLGIRQEILNLKPGAEYFLLGNIACRDLAGNVRLEVQDAKNGWKSFAKWTESVSGTQTWERVSLRFTLPDNVSQLALLLRRPPDKAAGAGEGAIWFDDIRLHRIH